MKAVIKAKATESGSAAPYETRVCRFFLARAVQGCTDIGSVQGLGRARVFHSLW